MKSLKIFICLFLNFYFASSSFQISFLKEINKDKINKNFTISPLSAYQVLGLTANGASGKTLEEMVFALGNKSLRELNEINRKILSITKKFTTVEIANAVMSQIKPSQSFLNAAVQYDASVELLKSIAQINNWCNLKTHGKIPKIMDESFPLPLLVLINAAYFKGSWKYEFEEKNTKKGVFYNLDNKSKMNYVYKMTLEANLNYYEDSEVQVVELPYTYDSMSAIIMLPKNNINDFIAKLTDEKYQKLIKKLNEEIVNLELPKFTGDFGASLVPALKRLGMISAFGYEANFPYLGAGSISDVYQKTYISIDEKGTEAAAVTIVTFTRSAGPTTYLMDINRPFLFMLRNKNLPVNNDLLFITKVESL